MEIKITWEKVRNRQGAKLLFDENKLLDNEAMKSIVDSVKFATFGGVPVIFTNSLSTDKKGMFLMKKFSHEWSKVKIAVENAIKNKFPETKFNGTPER